MPSPTDLKDMRLDLDTLFEDRWRPPSDLVEIDSIEQGFPYFLVHDPFQPPALMVGGIPVGDGPHRIFLQPPGTQACTERHRLTHG